MRPMTLKAFMKSGSINLNRLFAAWKSIEHAIVNRNWTLVQCKRLTHIPWGHQKTHENANGDPELATLQEMRSWAPVSTGIGLRSHRHHLPS